MTRARAAALLAAGCALAAAAAADGPLFGERHGSVRPFAMPFVPFIRPRRSRQAINPTHPNAVVHWLDTVVGTVVLVAALAVAAYALWLVGRALVRIARLRLAPSGARAVTGEYDPGDE